MPASVALVNFSHFQHNSHPRHHLPPLDLGYAASLLAAAGHRVLLRDTAVDGPPGAVLRQALAARPDLLVLRPAVHALPDAGLLGQALAGNRVPVVACGPLATVAPGAVAQAFPAVRACLVGEVEAILPGLLERWDGRGEPPRLAGLVPGAPDAVPSRPVLVHDLDALPWPAHRAFLDRPYRFGYPLRTARRLRMGYLLSSRGCPHRCRFCSPLERASLGKRLRLRDPASVAEEARWLEAGGATALYLQDDLPAEGPARFAALAQAFGHAGVSIPWALQARVGSIDAATARSLKGAGCSTVCLGVESGDPGVLAALDKGHTVEQAREQFAVLRAAGLLTVAFLVLGAPGEGADSTALTARLVADLKPDLLQAHVYAAYPGSRAFNGAQATLDDTYATKFGSTGGPAPRDRHPLAAQRALYLRFYLSPATWGRALAHSGAFYLANLPATARLAAALLRRLA
jgi:radical SAM superfamily enzyme YgiQ (UPF0313 family)